MTAASAPDRSRQIAAYLDGSLAPSEMPAFSAWLNADDAHARQLVEQMLLESHLRQTAPTASLAVPPERTASAGRTHRLRLTPITYAISGVAAAILLAGAVALYVFSLGPEPSTLDRPALPIATVVDTFGGTLLIDDNIADRGADYAAGTYSIDNGEAEFLLTNQVAVKLTGRTSLTMHSNMSATLIRGSAAFRCPPGAEGYTVHLGAGSRVVDLGTAFGIDIDDAGETSIRVSEGTVEWFSADASDEPLRLGAGEWVYLAPEATPGRRPILVTSERSDTPPTVSDDDLAQRHRASTSATGGNEVAADHAQLFNGQIGNVDHDTADPGEVTMNATNTVTVNLDIERSPGGYDITRIDSVFGWNTTAGGRSNQSYAITLTLVDGSTRTLVGPNDWEPNAPTPSYWTKVSFTDAHRTGVLASGVRSITFAIAGSSTAKTTTDGIVVGREIDIFGTPTPLQGPAPSTGPIER